MTQILARNGTILSPLGAGRIGEVSRARDVKLGRDVAIKILPRAFAADPAMALSSAMMPVGAAAVNSTMIDVNVAFQELWSYLSVIRWTTASVTRRE